MHWFGRARLFVLTLICLFWTGLIFVGHFFPSAPFISTPWRGEQSFEDLLRREGRKTAPHRNHPAWSPQHAAADFHRIIH